MTMSKAHPSDANRGNLGDYETQAVAIAAAQGIDLIDNYADWPTLTTAMTWNGDNLHPRWRASPDGPAFDTYSFPNIFAYCEAFQTEYWA